MTGVSHVKNKFRVAIQERRVTPGTWITIGHPAVAEIVGRAGFDWACIDLEHGAIDIETMTGIIRALESYDCIPVVRVPWNDLVWIRRSLDAGARGLIIPMVNTAGEAEQAVSSAMYPPDGVRGYGFTRASNYGVDAAEYFAEANDDIAVIVQIEHIDAVDNIDSILGVKRVDATFVGPYDLSGSMGITGQLGHPDMVAALETYKAACRKQGTASGLYINTPDEATINKAVADGFTMLGLGMDTVVLVDGFTQIQDIARK